MCSGIFGEWLYLLPNLEKRVQSSPKIGFYEFFEKKISLVFPGNNLNWKTNIIIAGKCGGWSWFSASR